MLESCDALMGRSRARVKDDSRLVEMPAVKEEGTGPKDSLKSRVLRRLIAWAIIPIIGDSATADLKTALWSIILFQYVPRVFLMLPLRSQLVDASGGLAESAWAAAAYNLFLYFVGSHVSGACFYILNITRQDACWRAACDLEAPSCQYSYLNCHSLGDLGRASWLSNLAAITSLYIREILFEIWICTLGLVLFALLLGNMARYLQSTTKRLDEWRLRWRDMEQWMHHRHLPPNLKQSVRTYEQFKWVATRGVDEEFLLRNLPPDLRRNIKRYLSLELVRRVPLFNQMDDRMLDAICERLKPVLFTEKMLLVREGDPVKEMFFLIRGHLDSWTTGGGRTGFFNSICLSPGDFCGDELLTWALDPRTSIVLPSSTRTVKAVKDVEAFALAADDLKFVASQYRRLHSKELRHKFRFYSHQWRTWAACFIQAAWRRCKKLKEEGKLSASEENATGPRVTISPGSFWDVYAQQLLESTRRDEGRQAAAGDRHRSP
ncbi:hypothetical protein MLD38_025256 [Melastoma candidum]|uniref:Uncharacterized protein n=1 Tax=Melastoma candidum TaxID=119954 RepID=A0ACB9NVR9_9MYRT|nr:hypothetical protein MLD38_025256 [Melastoma candidum]